MTRSTSFTLFQNAHLTERVGKLAHVLVCNRFRTSSIAAEVSGW